MKHAQDPAETWHVGCTKLGERGGQKNGVGGFEEPDGGKRDPLEIRDGGARGFG